MKDAGIEAKREAEHRRPFGTNEQLSAKLGDYEGVVRAALEEAEKARVVQRIWDKDPSVWKNEESHRKIISNSLGWLTAPARMLGAVNELRSFAERIRTSGKFQHVMVCGMGGSSLCPEVMGQTFGKLEGFPALVVLDSTDPDAINNFARQIDAGRCLFIIASKSGTTTEPITFHRYWYNEVSRQSQEPGKSFIAITDPGTEMVKTAEADGFMRIFLNQPDIGGRYSALSYFGMVPAALMGLDIERLLLQAEAIVELCKPHATTVENPAALLGAILAECAMAGRDKLTIVTDQKLSAVGLWIEQLIAESTGKEGKGIIPIVNEPLAAASAYDDDRLFVSIAAGTMDDETQTKLKAFEATGHPVVYRNFADVYGLGAEFFLWEMATAFAGWRLGINPFDQPNVQESKDATRALLERFSREGKLQAQSPVASDGTLTIYAGDQTSSMGSVSVADVIDEHLGRIKPRDYIALLAYVEETLEIETAIQSIRKLLRDATHCATTTGYGPRFLHSTGQLHKGGPDSGVFFQLTAPDKVDLPVPGAPYTFSILKQAQAQGDFQSLLSHGRRALRVDLGDNLAAGLVRLRELLERALS